MLTLATPTAAPPPPLHKSAIVAFAPTVGRNAVRSSATICHLILYWSFFLSLLSVALFGSFGTGVFSRLGTGATHTPRS